MDLNNARARVAELLIPGVTARLSETQLWGEFFITERASQTLHNQIDSFIDDSMQALDSHLQTLAKGFRAEGLPENEWPMVHVVGDENGLAVLVDQDYDLLLIAGKNEMRACR